MYLCSSTQPLYVLQVLEISLEHDTFPDTGLPIAEILVLAGFLFIYTLEELMHMILVCTGQLEGHGHEGHGHTHENIEVPIEESIQVRMYSRLFYFNFLSNHSPDIKIFEKLIAYFLCAAKMPRFT